MSVRNITAVGLPMLCGMVGVNVQAAALQSGDFLTIGAGSWFGLDMDMNSQISLEEIVTIHPGASGGVGIGGDYGAQVIGDIDYWTLFDKTGHHFTTTAPTGDAVAGLDFSGWSIYYDGAAVDVAVDYGAWTPVNCGLNSTRKCNSIKVVRGQAAVPSRLISPPSKRSTNELHAAYPRGTIPNLHPEESWK